MFLVIEWNNKSAFVDARNPTVVLQEGSIDSIQTPPTPSAFREQLPSLEIESVEQNIQRATATIKTTSLSNDVLSLSIDSVGGDIVGATLLNYYLSKGDTENKIELMFTKNNAFHRLQSGLLSTSGNEEPNHLQEYEYKSRTRNSVSFVWTSEDNISVLKTYTLKPGSYLVSVSYKIDNRGIESETHIPYYQLLKDNIEQERSMFDVESYSFDGGIIYDGDSYEKQYADDLIDAPYSKNHMGGWFANIRHHFVVALLPDSETEHRYEASHDTTLNLNKVSAISNLGITTMPGQTKTTSFEIFIGPKLQNELTKARDGLEVSVDFGRLSFLAKPMFWALNTSHGFLGNWGLAIIFVTFMIKLAFYRLQETSSKSMAKMRELAPRLKALNERYKDDKTALGQAQMEIYKKEGVNPMAGCLPLLIQIPFFIAFYWVLLESVEIRQAPFYLWLDDLSSRDPYYILPLLMGAVMFFQQKANPAPADPIQEKVFMFMPVMFTLLFAWFPSGLVLYWVTNSLLAFAQQWNVNRKLGVNKI